jgi:hypothetical protein
LKFIIWLGNMWLIIENYSWSLGVYHVHLSLNLKKYGHLLQSCGTPSQLSIGINSFISIWNACLKWQWVWQNHYHTVILLKLLSVPLWFWQTHRWSKHAHVISSFNKHSDARIAKSLFKKFNHGLLISKKR